MRFSIIPFLFIVFACNNAEDNSIHLPSQVYQYVTIDTTTLLNKHAVYVPIYSHLYTGDGTSALNLSATLSVRNTSYTDSFYVTDVAYYGSQGEVLKKYINKVVLLKPLASIEFVVERMEAQGGAGANFVVTWGASATRSAPLIQAVMNELGSGISFVTEGVEMN